MKATFFHDCKIKIYEKKFYVSGGLNDETLKRYTDLYDSLNIVTRVEEVKKNEGLMQIKSTKIYFNLLPYKNLCNIILFGQKKIKKEVFKSDICIIRLPSVIGNIALRYAIKYKKKYVLEIVGCPFDALWNHSLKGKIIAPIAYFIMKYSVRTAPFVVYVSSEFLQKRYPTKGMMLSCSDVKLRGINEEEYMQRIRKINNIKKDDKIILGTVAAVNVKYKGQQYVIKSISKLNKMGYKFEYHLVGGRR